MRKDGFLGNEFHWFTGEIISYHSKNKVRVYCHGYHPKDLPDNQYPFAHVMLPTTVGGTSDTAANNSLERGSWVVGFFRDGPSAQDPIIIGSLPSTDDGTDSSGDNKVYEFHGHRLSYEKNGSIIIRHQIGSTIEMDKLGDIKLAPALGKKVIMP